MTASSLLGCRCWNEIGVTVDSVTHLYPKTLTSQVAKNTYFEEQQVAVDVTLSWRLC